MNEQLKTQILAAAKEADLSFRDAIKLRLLMRFAPDRLAEVLADTAIEAGKLPPSAKQDDAATLHAAEIDWEALAAFIKEILPVVLELIKLFI